MHSQTTIRIVIIDDEKKSRDIIRAYLAQTTYTIRIVGEAASVGQGVEVIGQTDPDLLFLDVELKGQTGFDLLRSLGAHRAQVIFVTAYDKYAMEAFKVYALNYLLKPTSLEEVEASLKRYLEAKQSGNHDLRAFLAHAQSTNTPKKIAIKEPSGMRYVNIESIMRCEADGNYTRIHVQNDLPILSSKTLKEYEEMLSKHGFVRVHHSHLVSLYRVQQYLNGRGGSLRMEDGAIIEVSARKKDELMRRLESS